MPFPTVSIGQKIRASWGNLVAARFNERDALLAFSPGANTDATTSGTLTTWLTLGNVTVPSWAVSVIVDFYLVGHAAPTNGNTYDLRVSVGSDNGVTHRVSDQGSSASMSTGFADRITLTATGSQSVVLAAARIAGTGQFRANVATDAIARFTFLDN